jgi:hypothetical protein
LSCGGKTTKILKKITEQKQKEKSEILGKFFHSFRPRLIVVTLFLPLVSECESFLYLSLSSSSSLFYIEAFK